MNRLDSCDGEIGLYVHIPFCRSICHYCDFAKTANYLDQHVTEYLDVLERQLKQFINIESNHNGRYLFRSVFFGGGTPGLLSNQYRGLMSAIQENLAQGQRLVLKRTPKILRVRI